MNENKFMVDLGDLKLTAAQQASISNAIQMAVTNEIAKIGIKDQVFFIPKFPGKGPILPGFYTRKLTDAMLKNVLK